MNKNIYRLYHSGAANAKRAEARRDLYDLSDILFFLVKPQLYLEKVAVQ